MDSKTLRARVVYSVDVPAIDNGFITIAGEHIVEVGAKHGSGGNVGDLGDVAILPGFVNAHTHLEFSELRQPLGVPGVDFVEWIRAAIAARGRRTSRPKRSILQGCRESLRCGVTSVGEIATADGGAYASDDPLPEITLFNEVIGFSGARADSALAATAARMEEFERLPFTCGQPHRLGISPHAPYTVSPQLLGDLIQLARQRECPVAMHLAESEVELELLSAGTGPLRELLVERSMWDPQVIPRGSRPLDYLRQLAVTPRSLVIHGNYLADDEFEFLAGRREKMSLVHCPRTHAYFGHVALPISELLSRGVRVVIGTDSRASSPDLCVLSELRHVHRHHPHLAPNDVLRLGTIVAAEALGVADEVGSLTAGKLANLAVVPLPVGATGDPAELLASVFASDVSPMQTWLRGKMVEVDRATQSETRASP